MSKNKFIEINEKQLKQKQLLLLNKTLTDFKSKLLSQTLTKRKKIQQLSESHQQYQTKKFNATTSNVQIQTEDHLMYKLIEQQLKSVYLNVNKMKIQQKALRQQIAELKNSNIKKQNQVQNFKKKIENYDQKLSQLKSEKDKYENFLDISKKQVENLSLSIAAEKKIKETLEQKMVQTLVNGSNNSQQFKQKQESILILKQQIFTMKHNLNEKDITIQELLMKQKTLQQKLKQKELIFENFKQDLKKNIKSLSVLEQSVNEKNIKEQQYIKNIGILKNENQILRKEKANKQSELEKLVEIIENLEKQKQGVQNKEQNCKKKLQNQLIELQKNYSSIFEENIQLKSFMNDTKKNYQTKLQKIYSEMSQTKQKYEKQIKDKEIKFNLEICNYQKLIFKQTQQKKQCEALVQNYNLQKSNVEYLTQQLKRVSQQKLKIQGEFKHKLQKMKNQIIHKQKLIEEFHQKKLEVSQNYQNNKQNVRSLQEYNKHLSEYNQLLIKQNLELKRHSRSPIKSRVTQNTVLNLSKQNQRMRKMYINIWKDRFADK